MILLLISAFTFYVNEERVYAITFLSFSLGSHSANSLSLVIVGIRRLAIPLHAGIISRF